ncbi:hypothetical protein [Achromobacter kerstersii]|uniref:Uncharacterized protein n=1 Tax=Achromobacter kerstersii TaxID=1353890 RepID=A0A6S7BUF7_9BURK|nr:hypothetical protein [Achromobacter kerstersii]CAB3743269.1 hypothetical protein LMG3441_05968 [Achromobacter kerstersii]
MNVRQKKLDFNFKYQLCSQADGNRATRVRWATAWPISAAAHFFAFVVLTILGTAMWHAHSHDVPLVEAFQEAFLAMLLDAHLLIPLALISTVAGLRGGKNAICLRALELSKRGMSLT